MWARWAFISASTGFVLFRVASDACFVVSRCASLVFPHFLTWDVTHTDVPSPVLPPRSWAPCYHGRLRAILQARSRWESDTEIFFFLPKNVSFSSFPALAG